MIEEITVDGITSPIGVNNIRPMIQVFRDDGDHGMTWAGDLICGCGPMWNGARWSTLFPVAAQPASPRRALTPSDIH